MASLYDAVINLYENNDGALAEAWAIAELQGQDDLKKNLIRLYAALLVNDSESDVKNGYLVLQSGDRLSLWMKGRQTFLHHSGGDMDGLHGATPWRMSSRRQLPRTPEDLRWRLTNKHPFTGLSWKWKFR